MVPYSLVTNDMRLVTGSGPRDRRRPLPACSRDAFDLLWDEGATAPAMMSVGLHPRISGHPARAAAVARFLDHVAARDRVWVCRRGDRRPLDRHSWLRRELTEGAVQTIAQLGQALRSSGGSCTSISAPSIDDPDREPAEVVVAGPQLAAGLVDRQ